MKHGQPLVSFDDLIKAALTNQPYSAVRLSREAQRYSEKISRAKAPSLADDLHEDVFIEAFALMFQTGAAGLAEYGPRRLFRRAILKAIRKVRAAYAPAGVQTRAAHAKLQPQRVAARDVDHIVSSATLAKISVTDGIAGPPDFDQLADPMSQDAVARIDRALEIKALLKTASAEVSSALRRVHFDGEMVKDVANDLDIDRFVLNRRINAFFETCRAAA